MYILIGLGILVVASFVVGYYASRTWHWSQVALVLAVVLSSVGYLILAAETLGIHAILREQIDNTTKQLTEVQERNEALANGTEDQQLIARLRANEVAIPEDAVQVSSVRTLDHEFHMLTRIRGSVWRDVTPAGTDPKTGVAKATLASADAAGLSDKSIVFVFEQGEPAQPDPSQGKQYLGEFRVTQVSGQQLTLSPVLEMDESELQRLAASSGPWSLYETMPVDRHDIFADMSDEQLRQKLPAKSVDEYIRNDQETRSDDDPWRVVGYDEAGNRLGPDDMDKAVRKVYERRLRDYALEFAELSRQRVVMMADGAAVRQDKQRLQDALASAQKLQAFREEELQKLGVDLAGMTKDREAVERQLAFVERQRDVARERLAGLLQDNVRLASELATRQAALTSEINQKSAVPQPPDLLPAGAAL